MDSGKSAGAEVVLAEPAGGGGISTGDVSVAWKLQLRIFPGDEPPFELNVKMEVPIFMTLSPGMTLDVIYNPKHPEKIIVDPKSAPKDAREGSVSYVIESARLRGEDTTGMQEAADAETDPIAAAAAAARQRRANIMERSNAQLAASLRGSPPASGTPPELSVDAFKAQLEKLNQLKESGALDEDEYAAARQKLVDRL
jgi:Short C-terminal domain